MPHIVYQEYGERSVQVKVTEAELGVLKGERTAKRDGVVAGLKAIGRSQMVDLRFVYDYTLIRDENDDILD
jgi:hypothetical protein